MWSPSKQDLVTSDLFGVGVPKALDVDVVLAERWEVQEGEGRREVQLHESQQLRTALPSENTQQP